MIILSKNSTQRRVAIEQLHHQSRRLCFSCINRKLKPEFFSVIRDDCRENLRKMKTEHFLERQLPGLHTYRLGGSNYLTAAGEVAYFYKCRPRLVASHTCRHCYDALPVEIASENVTLTTYFQADGHEATVPKFYIEPLTHRLTSVAKRYPVCPNSLPDIRTSLANGLLSPKHLANRSTRQAGFGNPPEEG